MTSHFLSNIYQHQFTRQSYSKTK